MEEQLSLFEASYEKPVLPKRIRLIEFFAGIGAQAKALEMLGLPFEHHRTCEWSWQSIIAYNAIHFGGVKEEFPDLTYDQVLDRIEGVSNDYNKPMTRNELKRRGEKWAREVLGAMAKNHNLCPNVSKLHASDLGIDDRDGYTTLLTYSFPCQDLSNAGTLKGMEKGSGTRSGLLWEVERILNECKELDCLPQVLLMENVPGVCGTANLKPWNEWLDALEKLGYTNYWKILNAKDYGIPQNRRRCFMVSILGNYSYSFPRKFTPKFVLRDFASKEEDVPEEYYLSDKVVEMFQRINRKHEERGNGFRFEPKDGNGVSNTITTREGERTENTYLEVPMPSEDSEEVSAPSVVNHLEIPSATKKGYMEAYPGDGILPNWKGARGTVQRGGCPTILTSPDTIAIVVEKKDDEA